jgi:phage shock protein PspC (stress-responsive transcriptional regulator)
MKRILSIRIGGKDFQIEEDACKYLQKVLASQYNADETERKIAVEFERLTAVGKAFISYPDVVDVLYRLGIAGADFRPEPRMFYRCRNDRIIAGVCSGIGDYLNIDPTIVRICFVMLAFFVTMGIWLYLIIWIITPAVRKPQI